MNLSKALQRVRFEKGLTQVEVAKKAKITQTYLSQLETNTKKDPSKTVLQKLAKVYGVPVVIFTFLGLEESDVPPKNKHLYVALKPIIDSMISELIKS